MTFFDPWRLKAASDKMLHLDLLRLIASLGIVYFHSHSFLVAQQTRAASQERIAGFALFVDLFFVISGFVIAYVYSGQINNGRTFGRFMQRRVARLVPLHWLTLMVSIAVWWLILRAGLPAQHAPSFRAISITKTALLLNGIVRASGQELFFNEQSWSISAEMAMYLLFPIIELFAILWKSAPFILGLLCLAAIGFHFATQGTLLSYNLPTVFPVFRAVPSFLIGAGLFYKRDALRHVPGATWLFGVSILSLIAAMSAGLTMVLLLPLVYVTAITAIAADLRGKTSTLVKKLAPLGQLTYSIYMWHALFILVLMNGLGDKLVHGNRWVMIAVAPVCYGAILFCSYLSFHFIETPARRWIDSLSLFGSARISPVVAMAPAASQESQ